MIPPAERTKGESLEYRFYNLLSTQSGDQSSADSTQSSADSTQSSIDSKLEELIRDGFDIHNVYNHYTTAIHLASEFRNLPLVNSLLRRDAAIDILRGDLSDRDTALHIAAIGGDVAVFDALLQALGANGMNPNSSPINRHGMVPLHYALGKGNVALAELLLQRGAEISQADHTGATPLHFAARSGSVDALELIFARLPVPRDVNSASRSGLTALHYAAWNGRIAAMKWLLARGASLQARDVVEKGTPLHWAAMRGDKEAVRLLVEACVGRGLRVFSENRAGKSVLELAEEHGREHVRDLLRVVMEQGLLDRRAFPQISLVRYVIGYGDSGMIERLDRSLDYAIEKKKQNYSANLERLLIASDLVDWAAKRGNKESINLVMKLLKRYITYGSDPGLFERKMASALLSALQHGKMEFAASLADHRHCKYKMADILKSMNTFLERNVEDLRVKLKGRDVERFGKRAEKLQEDIPFAFWLFYEERQEIVKFIDTRRAWRDIVNEQGSHTKRTALHWATILGYNDVVTKLCEIRECKANLDDGHSKSPYRYAVERQHPDIRKELSSREDVRAYLEILYRDRQVFVDALNAILVGAALIASISFQGFLQPPGGLKGTYVYINEIGVKLFVWFNSLSFFFAMASTLAAARGVLPMPDIFIQEVVKRIERTLFAAGLTLAISITFGLLAFGAAGFSVLPPEHKQQRNLIATSSMGGIVCLGMLLWFLKGLFLLFNSYVFSRTSQRCRQETLPPSSFGSSTANYKHHVEEHECNAEKEEKKAGDLDEEKRTYDVGANYSEYPWQDGLDKLCENVVIDC
ncbi:uncharacterized protein LOC112349868 [Selaginella moellendorffii]|nr:uncharacterized protein LOC112349868 [Selaginella moellendorffii]|eukprot:XP_024540811.1 uncharacterized protein LOC112349868 [Selaginella moellendorffii]